jgi:hypothetical protein
MDKGYDDFTPIETGKKGKRYRKNATPLGGWADDGKS